MYDDEDCRASWAELEEDPRLVLCSCVVVTAEALEVSLVGVENLVIGMHVARVEAGVSFEATNLYLDVRITEYALMAFRSEESREHNLELPYWDLAVYENVNEHASLAESEVDSAAVFCSCFIVAAQAVEVGLVGIEALPVAVGTHWVIH